ncbi:hypothetical protein BU26DRAFT_228935 [Trematosphaeria pertusa]|uniref:Uncharacterized protein n=1 Tax=Trematosphaeria pertusa TaxID=390896 RepID=A0A6A6ITP3_9PLEO|nr:uncharacterized protein BU26DRAFT_228935 [Trematosphaeria pertusa]KAF2253719.1 hypothetical protein BU26DRAFT_228935 [Trematosphaeria pertusa]
MTLWHVLPLPITADMGRGRLHGQDRQERRGMGKCRLSCAMFTALAVGLIGPVTSGGLIRVGLRPKRDVCTSRAPYGPPPTTLSARNGARLWSEVSQALEMDILLHIPASDEYLARRNSIRRGYRTKVPFAYFLKK